LVVRRIDFLLFCREGPLKVIAAVRLKNPHPILRKLPEDRARGKE
jgi:hypothetical protein